jgi:hypothetical protein
MPPHRVTNLRDLLGPRGQPEESVRELARWLGALVECVTATGSEGHWVPVPVACRECPAGSSQATAVRRVGPGIEWLCTACHASGTLTGWEGSVFDLSEGQDEGNDEPNITLFTRLEELEEVRRHIQQRTVRRTLALAMLQREYVVLVVTRVELDSLLADIVAAAKACTGESRCLLERARGRCDAALGMLEQQELPRPATLH